MWRDDAVDLRLNRFFENSARGILSLLIVAILAAILAGTLYTCYDMRMLVRLDFPSAVKTILVDVLTVLAMVEVLRTALAYFSEGRVKVTYIIDTVIVTVLTDVMAFWYKEMDWQEIVTVIGLVLSLSVARIIAVRFSPKSAREEL